MGKAKTMCGICSKLSVKIAEQSLLRLSSDFIVNFEQVLHIFFGVTMVVFEQLYAGFLIRFIGIITFNFKEDSKLPEINNEIH